MGDTLPEVTRTWESFYLLIGTAGATLAGLLFVATSLTSRIMTADTMYSARIFTDPPLLAFTSSLVLSGLLLIPTLKAGTLGGVLLLTALLSTLYLVKLLRLWRDQRQHASNTRVEYVPDPSDWVWYVALPFLSNALIFGAGAVFLLGRAVLGLDVIAFTVLLLLSMGVRNAWDLMIWIVSHGGGS